MKNAPSRSSADTARPGSDEPDVPASPAPPQGEREAFEAWAVRTHGKHTLSDPDAGSMWSAWQARASLSASPAVPVAQDEREALLDELNANREAVKSLQRELAEARAALSAATPSAGWEYVVRLLVAAGHVSQEKVDQACEIASTPPAGEQK